MIQKCDMTRPSGHGIDRVLKLEVNDVLDFLGVASQRLQNGSRLF